eukprot:tig00020816_g14183.t1
MVSPAPSSTCECEVTISAAPAAAKGPGGPRPAPAAVAQGRSLLRRFSLPSFGLRSERAAEATAPAPAAAAAAAAAPRALPKSLSGFSPPAADPAPQSGPDPARPRAASLSQIVPAAESISAAPAPAAATAADAVTAIGGADVVPALPEAQSAAPAAGPEAPAALSMDAVRRRLRFKDAVRAVILWRRWSETNKSNCSEAEEAFLDVLESETRKAAGFYTAKVEEQKAGVQATGGTRQRILEACAEFVRVLDMLENRFRLLNVMASIKAVKKFDKTTRRTTLPGFRQTVENTPGLSSSILERLRGDITALVANTFFGSRMRDARDRLRVQPPAASTEVHVFLEGLFIGMTILLLIAIGIRRAAPPARAVALAKDVDQELLHAVFPIFRGIAVLVAYLWCWGFIILAMLRYRINFRFILDIKPQVALDHHVVFETAAVMTAVLLLAYWLFHSSISSGSDLRLSIASAVSPQYIPLYTFILLAVFALKPQPVHFTERRSKHQYCGLLRWTMSTVLRCAAAPFVFVKFRDFWMGDQLTSTVIVATDLVYSVCFYGAYKSSSPADAAELCGASSWWTPVIACIPFWIRMAQCLRRVRDLWGQPKGRNAQLWNALKYFSSILSVVTYAIYSAFHDVAGVGSAFFAVFILVSIWSTIHKLYWDIHHDWGLIHVDPEPKDRAHSPAHAPHAQRPPRRFDLRFLVKKLGIVSRCRLRSSRLFEQTWVYHFALWANVAIRLTWVFQTNTGLLGGGMGAQLLKAAFAILEAARRCLWNLFRIEHEQLRNCEVRSDRVNIAGLQFIITPPPGDRQSYRAFDIQVPLLFSGQQQEDDEDMHWNRKQMEKVLAGGATPKAGGPHSPRGGFSRLRRTFTRRRVAISEEAPTDAVAVTETDPDLEAASRPVVHNLNAESDNGAGASPRSPGLGVPRKSRLLRVGSTLRGTFSFEPPRAVPKPDGAAAADAGHGASWDADVDDSPMVTVREQDPLALEAARSAARTHARLASAASGWRRKALERSNTLSFARLQAAEPGSPPSGHGLGKATSAPARAAVPTGAGPGSVHSLFLQLRRAHTTAAAARDRELETSPLRAAAFVGHDLEDVGEEADGGSADVRRPERTPKLGLRFMSRRPSAH